MKNKFEVRIENKFEEFWVKLVAYGEKDKEAIFPYSNRNFDAVEFVAQEYAEFLGVETESYNYEGKRK